MENDNQIILKINQGKTDYYSIIMDKYHNEIFKYIYNMVGQYETTEDLLQEVFIKVYHSLKKYDQEKASFRTWLYRITSNHVMNYLKSKQYRKQQVETSDVDYLLLSDENIEETIIKDEQLDTIIKVMKKVLKPNHQRIMYLHYFSGLEAKEIADVMEISVKTVYKAIKTSIEKIQMEVKNNE